MPEASVGAPALIEWGVASLALPGEAESGDRHLVTPVGTGVLVAVVDGLGHGAEAASAAKAAVAALERHATESPAPLLERCHRALKGTRGEVMSVAAFSRHDQSMTWVGIVGAELPRLHPVVLAIAPGDTLFFATDGIREGFAEGLSPEAAPQQLADQILARHGKGTDDALVLVARYLGGAGTRG